MQVYLFIVLLVIAAFVDLYVPPRVARAESGSQTHVNLAAGDSIGSEARQAVATPAATPAARVSSFFDLPARSLLGEDAPLSTYRGKVVLAVNVASKCGLTPQYEGLEALYRELAPRGLVILGFPSNDFLGQEPGTPQEIRAFCDSKYGVTFPLFAKSKVKGDDKGEIYRFLTRAQDEPSWNFTKYLIDRHGNVLQRFDPKTSPNDPKLRQAIEAALAAQ